MRKHLESVKLQIHNDDTKEVFISIGKEYNKYLLNSEEAKTVQSEIIGYWTCDKKNTNKYEIHLTAFVSTEENPQAPIRNKIICQELGSVLERILFSLRT